MSVTGWWPHRSGGPVVAKSAETEWNGAFAKILILFRLLHAAQVATTLPSLAHSLSHPVLAIALEAT
jgi:hypothetical protein